MLGDPGHSKGSARAVSVPRALYWGQPEPLGLTMIFALRKVLTAWALACAIDLNLSPSSRRPPLYRRD